MSRPVGRRVTRRGGGPGRPGLPGRLRVGTVALVALSAVATAVSGCVSAPPVPTTTTTSPAPAASPAAPVSCTNARQSYAPSTSSAHAKAIQGRKFLVVGVSADTRQLGAVDPANPDAFQGFDIEIARLVAAELGVPIRFKVITTADRVGQLGKEVNARNIADGGVDLVARAFTMNCARWQQVAFSAVYFEASQGLMVPRASSIKRLQDLAGKTVCAPAGSTSLDTIKTELKTKAPTAQTRGVANHTDCLVLLQQGQVDAITGDDAILAGFKAQDPTTVVLPAIDLSDEPYGLGVNLKHKDFAAYVNAVLEKARASGAWQKAYDTHLRGPLGKAGTQPTPIYGRPLS